ncbi:GNAT family acetyltransferase, putative [Metarhizium acridum CQMa 102]|uniref:GNAT family acetyltransferase, putative n=1 Tax=Metarhizium acridum (strain CQMa 102) TaxID=655827 RepID=E9EFP6_METAQ|nr:GNAT family acetyltransferase, putative [Metarhizium acridum CQMa 102]EFY85284.1 GNAT family acetyltransferase, putative [Metarhizium acridum CQMa 102]
MKIRPATLDDVPAVARIVLSALANEAPWKAFLPRRAQADATHIEYCEAILRSYLEPANRNSWLILVVEISATDAKIDSGPIVVSVAVWDTSAGLGQGQGDKGRPGSVGQDTRSHAVAAMNSQPNRQLDDKAPAKLAALCQATVDGRRRHFSNHIPYIFLHLLATGPDYQRKGYGKALCASGINLARQKHASVCLQTASRGYILFSGLGFVDEGPVALPAEPGTEDVLIKAMVLDSNLIQRRGSIFDSLMRYITG